MHISKWLLRSSIFFYTFFYKWYFFYDFIFHKSEIRTVLLEVGIVLGLLKKTLLKTSKIILMYRNSLARHFSSMFHAICLLPRLDILLPIRSCLQNFYQCTICLFKPLLQLLCSHFTGKHKQTRVSLLAKIAFTSNFLVSCRNECSRFGRS